MTLIAIIAGKISILFSRLLKFGGGTSFPGLLAQKIDSNIIRKLTARLPQGAIVVTGTNGKTTTAKMISEILSEEGLRVLNNFSGANLTRGIASSLIKSSNFFGTRVNADIAVFEVDEATMTEAMTKIRPKVALVTNLFRDQLDRYGELDKTAEIIGKSFAGFTDLSVILNADDPLVASLSSYAEGDVSFFGIDDPSINSKSASAVDSKDCVECGHELDFRNRYFGHLGVWSCANCGLKRPETKYTAKNVDISPEKILFDLTLSDENLKIEMSLSGLYNAYNALAASAVSKHVCCGGPALVSSLKNFGAAFGRMETLEIEGRKVVLTLVKNPTGASQALSAIYSDDSEKNVVFALNDNFADGTDVSWIWDIDFEIFELKKSFFVASGIRAEDLALRLKYAGVDLSQIFVDKNPVQAVKYIIERVDPGEKIYVFPTYTALMEIRGEFAKSGDRLESLGRVTKRGI